MFEPTGTLEDLIPEVRGRFEDLVAEAEAMGLSWSIGPRGAGRTCAQQNALDPAATGARGCQSWHVLGRAVDLDVRPWSYEAYRELGQWWESVGGFWGGRWTQFGPMGDPAHFHWPEPGAPPGSPSGCPARGAACESYRRAYLAEAAGWKGPWGPVSAVLAGLFAAAGYLWWRR